MMGFILYMLGVYTVNAGSLYCKCWIRFARIGAYAYGSEGLYYARRRCLSFPSQHKVVTKSDVHSVLKWKMTSINHRFSFNVVSMI